VLHRSLTVTRALLILAALTASAQAPVIGDINIYGLQKLTPEKILATLKLRPGAPLPASKGDLEDRLVEMPEVVLARVEAVCCEGRDAVLFVGIEERGAPHAAFRTSVSGDAVLPAEILTVYRDYLAAVQKAAAAGNTAEDLTAGHPLMADPKVRQYQLRFTTFATELPLLRGVLRNSSLGDHRAIAATIIGYAASKKDVLDDLQFALSDPEEAVRSNAVRSLNAIAVLAAKNPELNLHIPATWFIELLHSVVLSDRLEAVKTLLTLSDLRTADALDQVRERALSSVVEMARWKTARYAAPAFLLVGRTAGMEDNAVERSWESGERESVIEKALAAARKRAP
jgi:hypothetical protein